MKTTQEVPVAYARNEEKNTKQWNRH